MAGAIGQDDGAMARGRRRVGGLRGPCVRGQGRLVVTSMGDSTSTEHAEKETLYLTLETPERSLKEDA